MTNKNKQQVEEIVEKLWVDLPLADNGNEFKSKHLELIREALQQAKEDILEEVIPVHNARILNEFQKLEDMDERILFRAITKATKETLTPNDKE